jgi:hypothetical protein
LTYAKRDRERDLLTEEDEQFILRTTQEIVEDLGESQATAPTAHESKAAKDELKAQDSASGVFIMAFPARDEIDRMALEMLQQLLDPRKWELHVAAAELLSSEMVSLAQEKRPALICIGSLPPGGLAHTRYLCKRLRSRLPNAKIVVGRWGLKGNIEQNRDELTEAGADEVETTLLETRNRLRAWLPVLSQEHREGLPAAS